MAHHKERVEKGHKYEMTGRNLELLRELTSNLPPVPIATGTKGEEGFYRYPTEGGIGTVLAWPLLAKPGIGVAHFYLSKGSKYPAHAHEKEWEYVIVYKGRLKCSSDTPLSCTHFTSNEDVIQEGRCSCFVPKQLHACEALEDTWLIAITVPKDEAYPG